MASELLLNEMFIQVIEARTADPEGLRAEFESWHREIAPDAIGFVGSTAGVTADGVFIGMGRFESEDAARANSARPEQGEAWERLSALFDGDAVFRDCTEVEVFFGGGSDDAGFVQVMQGSVDDKKRLRAHEAEAFPKVYELRPELLGSIRCWDGDVFTEFVYFTNEADARMGEAQDLPDELRDDFAAWRSLVTIRAFYDLAQPWLFSAP